MADGLSYVGVRESSPSMVRRREDVSIYVGLRARGRTEEAARVVQDVSAGIRHGRGGLLRPQCVDDPERPFNRSAGGLTGLLTLHALLEQGPYQLDMLSE